MITIIEGADGAGKSTLAHALVAFMPGSPVIHHQGPYMRDPLGASIAVVHQARERPLIADRFHIGEQVYGPIYRGTDRLGGAGRRMLERYLLGRGAVLILTTPPRAVAYAKYEERRARGKEMFDCAWDVVWDGFLAIQSALPIVRYNYANTPLPTLLAHVADARTQERPDGVPGGGRWAPGRVTLVVGERTKTMVRRRQQLPPGVPPFVGRTLVDEWLAEQFTMAGVEEDTLYWVNALDESGGMTPPAFVETLAPTRVIALGVTARVWCKAAGVTPIAVPHPAGWHRFHYHERYPLLDVLAEVTR